MGAGLERDVGRSAAHLFAARCRILECHDLGMGTAGPLGGSLSDDFPIDTNQNTAYAGVGRGDEKRGFGEGECQINMDFFVWGGHQAAIQIRSTRF